MEPGVSDSSIMRDFKFDTSSTALHAPTTRAGPELVTRSGREEEAEQGEETSKHPHFVARYQQAPGGHCPATHTQLSVPCLTCFICPLAPKRRHYQVGPVMI